MWGGIFLGLPQRRSRLIALSSAAGKKDRGRLWTATGEVVLESAVARAWMITNVVVLVISREKETSKGKVQVADSSPVSTSNSFSALEMDSSQWSIDFSSPARSLPLGKLVSCHPIRNLLLPQECQPS